MLIFYFCILRHEAPSVRRERYVSQMAEKLVFHVLQGLTDRFLKR